MWRRRLGWIGRWSLATLTLAVVVTWPVSGWWSITLNLPHQRSVMVRVGCLWFTAYHPPKDDSEYVFVPGLYLVPDEACEFQWRFWIFAEQGHSEAAVPLWAIVPILGAATALAWRGPLLTRRRRKRGACLACGYDRRGLTGPCPECGCGME